MRPEASHSMTPRREALVGMGGLLAMPWIGRGPGVLLAGAFLAGLQATLRRAACGKPNRRSPELAA